VEVQPPRTGRAGAEDRVYRQLRRAEGKFRDEGDTEALRLVLDLLDTFEAMTESEAD